jgi:tRNA-Thr(GGU) m(6)t(6)A37 methyltransferase TsaA
MELKLKPIGVVHSPYKDLEEIPIQGRLKREVKGTVDVFPEFSEGLKDLERFSHIILLYHFDCSGEPRLLPKPYLDGEKQGIFAIRAPCQPNPIGLTVVQLLKKEGNRLEVSGVDMIDKTPLLDIKPYVPKFDAVPEASSGWLNDKLDE